MRLLPLALLVLASAVWGSSYVVAKVALEEISPPLLAALRFGIATLVLWLILLVRRQTRLPTTADNASSSLLPRGADALRLVLLGAVGVAASGLLSYWGVSLTTATDAALLIVGEVLFTTVLAVSLIGERLTRMRSVALLVGLIGVIVLVLGGVSTSTPEAPNRPLGDLLILCGLAFESGYTVLGTRLSQRYDPLTVLTISLSGSCVVWLPVVGLWVRSGVGPPSFDAIAGVLYLAIVASVACYLVWFSVLRKVGATLGALSLLAQPVVGAALGIVLLGEQPTLATLLGGACVFMCLVLASVRAGSVEPRMVSET